MTRHEILSLHITWQVFAGAKVLLLNSRTRWYDSCTDLIKLSGIATKTNSSSGLLTPETSPCHENEVSSRTFRLTTSMFDELTSAQGRLKWYKSLISTFLRRLNFEVLVILDAWFIIESIPLSWSCFSWMILNEKWIMRSSSVWMTHRQMRQQWYQLVEIKQSDWSILAYFEFKSSRRKFFQTWPSNRNDWFSELPRLRTYAFLHVTNHSYSVWHPHVI